MPTVLALTGLRVVIYANDHRPAHVHVIGKGCEAVFHLHFPFGPPELRENYDFGARDLMRIIEGLSAHLTGLCTEWRTIHGPD